MEFVAEMLAEHLRTEHADRYEVDGDSARRFFGLFEALPGLTGQKAWNADRLVTRFLTYPAELVVSPVLSSRCSTWPTTAMRQLAHVLPSRAAPASTVMTSMPFSASSARTVTVPPGGRPWRRAQLAGLQRAALSSTAPSRCAEQIEDSGLLDPERSGTRAIRGGGGFLLLGRHDELPPGALPSRPVPAPRGQ